MSEDRTSRPHPGSKGPSVQQLLDRESRPVPPALRWESQMDLGNEGVSIERYTSPEFHLLEVEKVWRKTWQMVCRIDHIPEVGDHIVYDIADDSFIITRSAPDTIQAFQNACLHRGRTLRTQDGFVPEFRCPFHGFTWRLDGSLKEIPAQWDFPKVDPDKFCLPEATVGTWGGFVFINMDPNCVPLDEYLEGLGDHFASSPLDDRHLSAHVAKVIPANWKAMQDAFIESFHVIATHPQLLQSNGDENTQYDIWPDKKHISRSVSPSGVPSPHLNDVEEQDVLDNYMLNRSYYGSQASGRDLTAQEDIELDDGTTAREHIAGMLREQLKDVVGEERAEASTDSELMDAIQYFVFPNFVPWLATGSSIVYRFRPNGNNPDSSIAEIMFLTPVPEGTTKPPPVPVHWLGEDEDWTNATEIGRLGAVANQDSGNIPYVQRGMKALARTNPLITLSNYQEVRIRHFHQTLDYYLEQD